MLDHVIGFWTKCQFDKLILLWLYVEIEDYYDVSVFTYICWCYRISKAILLGWMLAGTHANEMERNLKGLATNLGYLLWSELAALN